MDKQAEAPPDNSMSYENGSCVVDVSDLAQSMREQVRAYTARVAPERVHLAGVLARNGPHRSDSEVYAERIAETLESDGIDFTLYECIGEKPSDVSKVIREMNGRSDVHGILVFYPIFKKNSPMYGRRKGPYLNRSSGVYYKSDDDWLRDVVSPLKDVEGLGHNYNARWIFRARGRNRMEREVYIPCTALAVMKILQTYHPLESSVAEAQHKRWAGFRVTIVNRSEILGRPLAALLALEGASVYSVDDSSILEFMDGGRMRLRNDLTLNECLRQSAIVVTGVPSEDYCLPCDMILPETTVVNISEYANVDEAAVIHTPHIRLIPQIGKVTVAALEQNLILLHQRAMANK
jgi:methylenetetrahydrofolate dehydrogenase (NAD+)